jgi:hypothetical protein
MTAEAPGVSSIPAIAQSLRLEHPTGRATTTAEYDA